MLVQWCQFSGACELVLKQWCLTVVPTQWCCSGAGAMVSDCQCLLVHWCPGAVCGKDLSPHTCLWVIIMQDILAVMDVDECASESVTRRRQE